MRSETYDIYGQDVIEDDFNTVGGCEKRQVCN